MTRWQESKKIKVLLIYHGAALEPSRKIFAALAKHDNIMLRVLGPRKGFNPARNKVFEISRSYYGEYDLVPGRVYRAMKDFSGPYLTRLLREMLLFKPHIIHVFNEATSRLHLQVLVYRNLFLYNAKVLFFGFENIFHASHSPSRRWLWNFICRNGNGGGYANTEGLKRLGELGYPTGNLMLTYWGVPLDSFFPSRNELLRRELGIHDKFVVGYVGRFSSEKGLSTLLRALKHLPDSVHCFCVGDGPWLTSFRRKVAELGLQQRLHWVSRVADRDVVAHMNALDVLILPSETTSGWKEQFGRVLPEAMACGVPIIGSNSGAIPEIIGDAGKVFPEGDHDALAAAIRNLYENPALRSQLARKGIERAREYFSCEAFAKKLVQLYLNTVASK
jgi:glycosyltransferase involved in cell wall biosynthesis